MSVSNFVAVFNQTLSVAYPNVVISGELANFRVSKNRWVYFDLKDEQAAVRFFGTVYNLPGPLEDGMMLTVRGVPQLHPQFGFSITIQTIQLAGEGTIKKAAKLLEAQLAKEGLFDPARKRSLPYPPQTIGLITSGESAAYADFVKILNQRWGGVNVQLYDVQVQGEAAPAQIVRAVEYFNSHAVPPEVLIITRGGGSADDLQAFSTEGVTRAIAASRIPTLVAIGHEVDMSLAEMAADQRASTPSNAAELLVPDKREVRAFFKSQRQIVDRELRALTHQSQQYVKQRAEILRLQLKTIFDNHRQELETAKSLLNLLDPQAILGRGYAIVRKAGVVVRSAKNVKPGDTLAITLAEGRLRGKITDVEVQ